METTEKYGLGKPDKGEFYDIDVQNNNMDIIDEELEKRPTSDGDASSMTVDFEEASENEELTSGEKLSAAFGKIAKAIKDFISHITTKATTSTLGHVKLSDSSAVTDSEGLALPAKEKNASIEGTLANQISSLTTDLKLKNQIKTIVVTGTTSDSGNIITDLDKTAHVLLARVGWDSGLNIIISPFASCSQQKWFLNCKDASGNIYANKQVGIVVYYYES